MCIHNYVSVGETLSRAKTPLLAKPPFKKGKEDDDISSVISTLSHLINTCSDTIEKMVSENALKLKAWKKKNVDFVCAKLNDIKGKVSHFEMRLNTEEKKVGFCERPIDL